MVHNCLRKENEQLLNSLNGSSNSRQTGNKMMRYRSHNYHTTSESSSNGSPRFVSESDDVDVIGCGSSLTSSLCVTPVQSDEGGSEALMTSLKSIDYVGATVKMDDRGLRL
ncbi:hypothetical protein HELRODRAFT_167436 [Helobdella robusta]|uniref:Uncharacterized protein n=1 Tax=Helobdella robusta TaxID=6412 RepID=T1EZD4_HELRO|nr:hypothetical protein HELRODRAFT_167436 [Helobdella robusta]ESO10920.1 hypothetical protein HELRODRAFT_167436 [Helobdella robusta]